MNKRKRKKYRKSPRSFDWSEGNRIHAIRKQLEKAVLMSLDEGFNVSTVGAHEKKVQAVLQRHAP